MSGWLQFAEWALLLVLSWKLYCAGMRIESLETDLALLRRRSVAARREVPAPWAGR